MKEKVFILQPILNDNKDYDTDYKEIISLVDSADGEFVGSAYQNIKDINPATYFGEGKLKEIKSEIEILKADTVVFNGELSPSQTLNISAVLNNIKVIDRTTLILDIFAQRAVTSEGKLQVALAQLKYYYPRLKGKGQALSRLGGGIGTRGPGESQLETDRRHIRLRINYLEKQLHELEQRRLLQTERRIKNAVKRISLVGYTNTGKSTLLNSLTGSDVLVKNQLFATLDPTARKISFENFDAIISDTVGFINNLPHNLVEAFKSTLESALNSDLILIVCDATDNYEMQLSTTLSTLEQMKFNTPYFIIINKCDELDEADKEKFPNNYILISAKEKYGLEFLEKRIFEFFKDDYVVGKINIPYSQFEKYKSLKQYLKEKKVDYNDENVVCDVSIPKIYLPKFTDMLDYFHIL